MKFHFAALHAIAALRGDGLRPELVNLLNRSRAIASMTSRSTAGYDGDALTTSVDEAADHVKNASSQQRRTR